MVVQAPLQSAAESLFADIAAEIPAKTLLLSHFSTTQCVSLQHDYMHSPTPFAFIGVHAVRSYFDLLTLHWMRDDMRFHDCIVHADKSQVVIKASVRWTWRMSRRSWLEEFTCTLGFDENLKVKSYIVETNSTEDSCVMLAIDVPSL